MAPSHPPRKCAFRRPRVVIASVREASDSTKRIKSNGKQGTADVATALRTRSVRRRRLNHEAARVGGGGAAEERFRAS